MAEPSGVIGIAVNTGRGVFGNQNAGSRSDFAPERTPLLPASRRRPLKSQEIPGFCGVGHAVAPPGFSVKGRGPTTRATDGDTPISE